MIPYHKFKTLIIKNVQINKHLIKIYNKNKNKHLKIFNNYKLQINKKLVIKIFLLSLYSNKIINIHKEIILLIFHQTLNKRKII